MMRFEQFDVSLERFDQLLVTVDLMREMLEQLVFQAVLLALVICLHQSQTGNIHVQVHLFLDARVTGTQRLDLRIGKRSFIHVVA